MCLAQGPQRSGAAEAQTSCLSVSSQVCMAMAKSSLVEEPAAINEVVSEEDILSVVFRFLHLALHQLPVCVPIWRRRHQKKVNFLLPRSLREVHKC